MSTFARTLLLFACILSGALALGCSESHSPLVDGGAFPDAPVPGDAACTGFSSLICLPGCSGDAGVPPICVGAHWECPPGTTDILSCPPSCLGGPPSPECVCRGSSWSCPSTECPAGINPWASPGTECSDEGAHCQSGGTDPCGGFLSCDCEEGHWDCLVAEPDPVCSCGREPAEGDRCSEEGASCGECCPTPGGTGWDAMTCVEGHWRYAACPEIECAPIDCPADRAESIGRFCSIPGQVCGNGCCSDAITCNDDGRWGPGPELDCICDPTDRFECGSGSCYGAQACSSFCGPADGVEHSCVELTTDCGSCDCLTPPPGSTCEMRDGHVYFVAEGFCG